MNCPEARERLSDLLDEALAPAELAEIRTHLDGCPDCRRELERLRATLGILSRVERPRAPAGFVDRVMAAAHPAPWYRRLGRWLFLPLGTKLPAEAAAMVMIAVLGVFLLQRTPEMQDAGRPEFPSPAPGLEAPVGSHVEPAPSEAPAQTASKPDKGGAEKPAAQAPGAAREAENAARDGRRRDLAAPSPSASEEPRQEPKKEGDADRLQKSGAPGPQQAPAPSAPATGAAAPAAPPPESRGAESRAKSRDAAESESGALVPATPPRAASPMTGKRQSAMSAVFGRLNVKDRPSAERGLAELLSQIGGSETGRRQELGATVVELLVPEARYAEFVRGLTALGAWIPEGQPTALPTDPPQLRFSIRIAE